MCATSSQRRSVPPKETRFSGLYRNKPAAQHTAERRGGFPVCTATNWWCSPAISDTSKKRSAYSSKRKPRKEEEPSSTAAHSPQAHLHRTRARTHFFCMDACPRPRKMRPLCGAARGGWGAYRCIYMVRGAYLALGRPRRPRRGTSG